MKKVMTVAAAAAIAFAAAAPVAADEVTADPFVSTQGTEILPIIIMGTLGAAIIVGALDSGSDT